MSAAGAASKSHTPPVLLAANGLVGLKDCTCAKVWITPSMSNMQLRGRLVKVAVCRLEFSELVHDVKSSGEVSIPACRLAGVLLLLLQYATSHIR